MDLTSFHIFLKLVHFPSQLLAVHSCGYCSQMLHEIIPLIVKSNISTDQLYNIHTLDCGQLWKVE
jgi:hypothetical protein